MRRRRTSTVRLASLVCISLLGATGAAQDRSAAPQTEATRPTPRTIKLGYVGFESPRVVSSDSGLHSTVRYLQRVSSLSGTGPWKVPVGFDISVGNYYQVWSWFRRKQIDAALVSPFIAYLLEREGDALAVLEFREHCDPAGHQPLIAASGEEFRKSPVVGYEYYLANLYRIASGRSSAQNEQRQMEELVRRVRLNLVAHLSSSGFVMPALYAREWLLRTLPKDPETERVNLDADAVHSFWRLFIEHARFGLHHGVQKPEGSISDIYFAYSGRPSERLLSDRNRGQFVWQGYHLGGEAPGPLGTECVKPDPALKGLGPKIIPPEIPNDVLIVRRELINELFGSGRIDRALLGDQLLPNPARGKADAALFASDAGYAGVSWFSSSAHQVFRQRIEALFDSNSHLRRTERRWFERGWFDFTIDETMGLLRQDQLNSRISNLALVLSGGGVKSLYQTQLLDSLYFVEKPKGPKAPKDPNAPEPAPTLSNFDADAVVQLPIDDDIPLRVRNVIGTSGGAMLAYFAAQLPIKDRPTARLSDILTQTSSQRLFPPADVPRVVSVVVLLALLLVMLNVARMFSRNTLHQAASDGIKKECPWMIYAIEALFIVGGALVIVLARHENQETARGVEGTMYALLVALAHFSVSCIGRSPEPGARTLSTPAFRTIFAGFCLGVMMVVTGLSTFSLTLADDPLRESRVLSVPPLLGISGLCVMSLALITYAVSGVGRLHLAPAAAARYFKAFSFAALVVGLSYGMVLTAAWLGVVSTLELTGGFWQMLIVAGLVTPSTLILIGRYSDGSVGQFLRAGTIELMRDRYRNTTTSLAGSLASIAILGVTCWTVIVAPALYGNEYARSALRTALSSETLDSGSFKSNLIVTGALLEDTQCAAARRTIPPGGLYFCFGGSAGCREVDQASWQTLQAPPPRRALDAVFASGSPFPVFSPHTTRMPNGCRVPLVDGGYAHNVPLEAASLTDARQVLAINASPDPRENEMPLPDVRRNGLLDTSKWTGGQLVRFSSRIFDFMFSRAQDLDRTIGSNLLVATLTPRPEDRIWPFLLDFTPGTRARMIREARNDVERKRRIGRVESWGFPVFLFQVRPGDNPLKSRSWSSEIKELLTSITASASASTVVALDLDNTILRGDIGDAMFLKMVVELRYSGDDPRFWNLFSNKSAARRLQKYWYDFKDKPAAEYLKPQKWNPDFADYVVLFLRQYEEMLKLDDGRTAYPWVVRLMGGLGAEEIRKMAAALWTSEMERPAAPLTIHSKSYGDYEIQGGLRVHQEMKQLIDGLQQRQAQVWIVTASSEWLGQYVAGVLGIPPNRVLGMRLQNPAGFDIAEPPTYREGKRQALAQKGLKPVLAIGDSKTDIEMLSHAERAIVINRGKILEKDLPEGVASKILWQPYDLLASQTLLP